VVGPVGGFLRARMGFLRHHLGDLASIRWLCE
jgi:hypothetical protein